MQPYFYSLSITFIPNFVLKIKETKKMDRATAEAINNDRQITDLRMDMEELINNRESLSEEVYTAQSKRIQHAINQRFEELYAQYK